MVSGELGMTVTQRPLAAAPRLNPLPGCSATDAHPWAIAAQPRQTQYASTSYRANDPLGQFQEWFAEARSREVTDATAMSLATADAKGRPSVRMVLLKAADARGFVFYTNLGSPKIANLTVNPRAALCLHWAKLERQVR